MRVRIRVRIRIRVRVRVKIRVRIRVRLIHHMPEIVSVLAEPSIIYRHHL